MSGFSNFFDGTNDEKNFLSIAIDFVDAKTEEHSSRVLDSSNVVDDYILK